MLESGAAWWRTLRFWFMAASPAAEFGGPECRPSDSVPGFRWRRLQVVPVVLTWILPSPRGCRVGGGFVVHIGNPPSVAAVCCDYILMREEVWIIEYPQHWGLVTPLQTIWSGEVGVGGGATFPLGVFMLVRHGLLSAGLHTPGSSFRSGP